VNPNDTNPKINSVTSWNEVIMTIMLSDKRFDYIKTSMFSGMMIVCNLVVSTRLIFIEASKDAVEWRDLTMLGVEMELPSATYILVIANIVNFVIIFGAKLIEKHFNKKESTNGF